MILNTESWTNIRRFRAPHAAGATFAEIGHACSCDWRTVRNYLAEDAASVPPSGPPRAGCQPLLISPAEFADRDENPLSGLHRRFEVIPGARAQVDWAMRASCWPMSASRTCTRSTWS